MNWAVPKKRSTAGWTGIRASCRRNNDKDAAFRGFNLPLVDPCGIDEAAHATVDIIAPSNEELRRSLPQFAPPPEWFDDGLEEKVW